MAKQNAETKLYAAVAKAAVMGNLVIPGQFIQREYDGVKTRVCLCGSVLRATGFDEDEIEKMNGEEIIKATAKKLGITLRQAGSLNNGFEAAERSNTNVVGTFFDQHSGTNPLKNGSDKQWYDIGRGLRKAYDGE